MPANRTVTITVLNGDGDINYDVSVLHVDGGDNMTWKAGPGTGPFGITFSPGTPLAAGGATLASSGPNNDIVGTVKSGLQAGALYRYSVWATYNGQQFTDPLCPELIIRTP